MNVAQRELGVTGAASFKNMKERIILDLCGGSGSWGAPYKEAGYDYRLITLPRADVRLYSPPRNVWGILAAPPCTEFSVAKTTGGKGRDFLTGLEVVSACMRIILTAWPTWWALENPVGYLSRWLGPPLFVFQPWEFGADYTKKTAIWGRFRPPLKTESAPPPGAKGIMDIPAHELHPEYKGLLSRAGRRAITPAGFAQAFFEVNP